MFAGLVSALAAAAPSFNIKDHKITGMMVAVYTPMKPGGMSLDLDIVPSYASFLKAKNITNIMPAGSNGESLSLTVPERKALAEAWAKAAAPLGLNVYMHVGSESVVDAADLAAHSAATDGIKGILAMTPVYFKPTTETLLDFLAHIAAAAPTLPFWFYHFPDDTGVMPGGAHDFLELADSTHKIPTLMGIKYTDYNMMDFMLCTQVANGKYNMLYGRDEQAITAFLLGADAAVSSTIAYSPTLRNAVELWSQGKQAEAKAQQELNAKLCSFFGAYESEAYNVQKSLMGLVGMPVGSSRLPKRDLTADMATALKAKLTALNLLDA